MRIKKLDTHLVLISLTLIFWSSYKLFFESYSGSLSTGPKIAKLLNPLNTVKRKSFGFIAWNDANQNEELSLHDQIYTYKDSFTDIYFKSGSKISLSENTLFKIEGSLENTRLELDRGSFLADIKDNSQIKVKIANENYVFSSSDAKIQVLKQSGVHKVVLQSGLVKLDSKGSTKTLNDKQMLIVDTATGKSEIQSRPFFSTRPLAGAILYFKDHSQIQFKWKALKDISEIEILISKDQDFQQILKIRSVGGQEHTVKNLDQGVYYWKLKGKQRDKSVESLPQSLSLIHIQPPTLKYPLGGQVFSYEKNPILPLLFEWNHAFAQRYRFQLFYNQTKIKDQLVKSRRLKLEARDPGKYSWTVRVEDPTYGQSNWSAKRHFDFDKLPLPSAPQPIQPIKNFRKILYQQAPIELKFSWSEVEEASGYELTITNQASKVLHQQQLNATSYTWSTLNRGIMYWSVRSLDPDERPTRSSPKSMFKIDYVDLSDFAPSKGTKIVLRRPDQQVNFKWKQENAESYSFELSEDPTFQQVRVRRKVDANQVDVNIPKLGVYYWRVSIPNQNGGLEFGHPIEVTVEPSPPPQKPSIDFDEEIEIQIRELPNSSSWWEKIWNFVLPQAHATNFEYFIPLKVLPNQDAKIYHVEIYSDKNLTKLIKRIQSRSPEIEWKNPKVGNFYWRYAIQDYWDRVSEYSDLSYLKVLPSSEIKSLKDVKLQAPKHNHKIAKNEKSLLFEWDDVDYAETYEIQISDTLDFKKLLVRRQTSKESIRVNIKNFIDKKNIYWQVRARGKYGQSSKSQKRRFLWKVQPQKKMKKSKPISKDFRYNPIGAYIQLNYGPTSASYEQTTSRYNVKISGTTINTIGLKLQFKFNDQYLGQALIHRSSGKVFDKTLKYQALETGLFVARNFPLNHSLISRLKLGAFLQKVSGYTLTTDIALANQDESSFTGVFQAELDFKMLEKISLMPTLGIGVGGIKLVSGQFQTTYHYKKNLFFNAGFRFAQKIFKSEDREISLNESQLYVGIGKPF